jgi:hypothetical protein
LALPKEVPPVFDEELLLYHWYVSPVPTPVVFNTVGEVPVHTLWVVEALDVLTTDPLIVSVTFVVALQPVAALTVVITPLYVPDVNPAGILIPVMLPLPAEVLDTAEPVPIYPATKFDVLPVRAKLLKAIPEPLTDSVAVVIAVLLPAAVPWLNLKYVTNPLGLLLSCVV